ncbi:mechanosensitive ion channel family protein [Kovacikia minuta CCNUW1]|uniref:mechanosensitive ion channel family protein n=1 Tax=Kovacikia minuta TaxID=2931930 RepID=UPI001CCF4D43|nr:mechanosensitive ion channel family protein [Kovacikia minuta]UBF29296.1 mechanosensitive ion channel family protein [Kovacikia minuta CCNUW1]
MDIVITVAQVIFLIVAFTGLNWLVRILFKLLTTTWLKGQSEKLLTLRQNVGLLLLLIGVGLCLLIVSVNGVLIYQGKSVQEFQLNLVRSIPAEFWLRLVTAIAKCITLLLLVKLCLPFLHRLLDWATTFAKNYDRITANDEAIEAFFTYLNKTLTNSVWILAGIVCTQFLYLPDAIPKYLTIALKSYLAIAIGQLVIKTLTALIDTLDALSIQYSNPDNLLRYYERFRHLVPALKKSVAYVLYVGIAALIIREIEFIAWIASYAGDIIGIITIYFACGVLIELANVVLEDLVLKTDHLTDLQRQRRLTIIPLLRSILKYTIYFSAALLILRLFDIDPTPLLAGAGLVGIIVGFGAQNLINDIVCGFFVLFENYYLVGDYIEAGKVEERAVEGIVEAIELRTTHIRHPDGQLQIIRNGEIGSIINYSKQYTYAKVEVPVPDRANVDQVYSIIEAVGQQLKAECLDVLEPTQVDGIENFGKDNLVLRTLTKVKPGKHLDTQRLLRKKLMQAFHQKEEILRERAEGEGR